MNAYFGSVAKCSSATRLPREHPLLSAILVLFVLLAGLYSVITPIYEAPDEIGHFQYIKYIADRRAFPVLTPDAKEDWPVQGHQLPLYYIMGAVAISPLDTSDADQLWHFNPHAIIGTFRGVGNRNWVAHTREEAFPYHGTVLAIHLVRFLSILMGAATVLITYFVALEIFPRRKGLAAGAALFVAFNPQFLFISGAVNNDNLAALLSSVVLLSILRILRKGASTPRLIYLGVALGLAALSKLHILGLLLLGILVLLLLAVEKRSPTLFLKGLAILLLSAFITGGWWYLRNWAIYGEPTGVYLHRAVHGRRVRPLTLRLIIWQAKAIKWSYWATFGWFNIRADSFLYNFFDLLGLLSACGLILAAIRGLKHRLSLPLAKLFILLAWVLILGGTILGMMWEDSAHQGRMLFPAISAISFLLFFGLSQLTPRRYTTLLAGLLGGIMLLIAVITPFRYIAPAYAKPPLISEDEIASIPHRLDVTFGGQMRLLG
ncbi:MAG: glycosyltransferase family 39 protein, partial [Anaerolineae bacterium]